MTEVGSIHIAAEADTSSAQQQLELLHSVLSEIGRSAQSEAARIASFGKAAEEVGDGSAKAATGLRGMAESAAGMVKQAADLGRSLFFLKEGFNIVSQRGAQMWEGLNEGARSLELADSFRSQLGGSEAALDSFLGKLREASSNTINDTDLIRSASRAMALGVTQDADEMAELMEIARFRGRQMGLDVGQAFSDIATGIGRGSAMLLDNLGIVVRLPEVYGAYAESVGKTVEQLSAAEKQQALLNQVLQDGREQIEAAGGMTDSVADKYRQLTTDLQNAGSATWEYIAASAALAMGAGTEGGVTGAVNEQIQGWQELDLIMAAVAQNSALLGYMDEVTIRSNAMIGNMEGVANILSWNEQAQWAFAESVRNSAEEMGISNDVVEELIDKLGLAEAQAGSFSGSVEWMGAASAAAQMPMLGAANAAAQVGEKAAAAVPKVLALKSALDALSGVSSKATVTPVQAARNFQEARQAEQAARMPQPRARTANEVEVIRARSIAQAQAALRDLIAPDSAYSRGPGYSIPRPPSTSTGRAGGAGRAGTGRSSAGRAVGTGRARAAGTGSGGSRAGTSAADREAKTAARAAERDAAAVAREWEREMQGLARRSEQIFTRASDRIRSAASSAFDLSTAVGEHDFLLEQFGLRIPAVNEIGRRLQDVVNRGADSPWAVTLPELLGLEGDALRAQAARLLRDIEDNLRPDLLDFDALVANAERNILGSRNREAYLDRAVEALAGKGYLASEIEREMAREFGESAQTLSTGFVEGLTDDLRREAAAKQIELQQIGGMIAKHLSKGMRDNLGKLGIIDAVTQAVLSELNEALTV
jgi:hypothetical protein